MLLAERPDLGPDGRWHGQCSVLPRGIRRTPRPMNPTLEQLLARSLPRHELTALGDVDFDVTLRIDGVASRVILGGISARLLHVRDDGNRNLAAGMRAMLCIELDGGAIRVDVPVLVVAAGRTSSVLRMLATPLVLRRRMVRDQTLSEALGVAPRRDATRAVA